MANGSRKASCVVTSKWFARGNWKLTAKTNCMLGKVSVALKVPRSNRCWAALHVAIKEIVQTDFETLTTLFGLFNGPSNDFFQQMFDLEENFCSFHSLFVLPTEGPRIMAPPTAHQLAQLQPQLRSPTPAGAPIILAPRMPQFTPTSAAGLVNGAPPPLVSPAEAGLIYPYSEYAPYGLSPTALFEYPTGLEQTAAGTFQVRWVFSGWSDGCSSECAWFRWPAFFRTFCTWIGSCPFPCQLIKRASRTIEFVFLDIPSLGFVSLPFERTRVRLRGFESSSLGQSNRRLFDKSSNDSDRKVQFRGSKDPIYWLCYEFVKGYCWWKVLICLGNFFIAPSCTDFHLLLHQKSADFALQLVDVRVAFFSRRFTWHCKRILDDLIH